MIVSVSVGIKSGDAFSNAFNIHEILKIPIKKRSEMKGSDAKEWSNESGRKIEI